MFLAVKVQIRQCPVTKNIVDKVPNELRLVGRGLIPACHALANRMVAMEGVTPDPVLLEKSQNQCDHYEE